MMVTYIFTIQRGYNGFNSGNMVSYSNSIFNILFKVHFKTREIDGFFYYD